MRYEELWEILDQKDKEITELKDRIKSLEKAQDIRVRELRKLRAQVNKHEKSK